MAMGLVSGKLQVQSQRTQEMKGGHWAHFRVAKWAAEFGTLPPPSLAPAEQSVSSGCGTLFWFFCFFVFVFVFVFDGGWSGN